MKVVIVKEIDEMPEDCDSCPFQDFDRNCGILGEYTMLNEWVEDAPYYDLKGKGDCPLRLLPNRWIPQVNGLSTEQQIRNIDFASGWNTCLKKITGETE